MAFYTFNNGGGRGRGGRGRAGGRGCGNGRGWSSGRGRGCGSEGDVARGRDENNLIEAEDPNNNTDDN
eukprot:9921335-Ditylum_brightwellii.AAC.1